MLTRTRYLFSSSSMPACASVSAGLSSSRTGLGDLETIWSDLRAAIYIFLVDWFEVGKG
jgi:hypothetical protein